MAKRFKLKFPRVISSFQFCRLKHPSTHPINPSPAIYGLSPVNPKAFDIVYPNLPAPPSTPEHHFYKHHVSSSVMSVGCGCRTRSCTECSCSTGSPDYTRKKGSPWPVVAGAHESKTRRENQFSKKSISWESDSDKSVISIIEKKKKKKKEGKNKEKETKSIVRTSISARDRGWFSSEVDEEEESDTLMFTSRSFSNDSSNEFSESAEIISKKSSKEKVRRLRGYASKTEGSTLRRMIPCTVHGKVRESVAVVKKTEEPYEDFKRSMLEMILEKQIFETKDLEELLLCFLSLNSRLYHGVIVEAFSEIWEVLFCDDSPGDRRASVGF